MLDRPAPRDASLPELRPHALAYVASVPRKVLDQLRHKMALNYLSGKKVSVNETAYLVGFSEPSAFSRAFKRWTGTRPGKRAASVGLS